MIEITFKSSVPRVIEALRQRSRAVVENVTTELDRSMLELQRRIQKKMSGEVLKSHRGGAGLLGSVNKVQTKNSSGIITGAVQAGGGPFWWLAVHEHGGQKEYEILPGALTGKSAKRALAFFPRGSAGASFGRTRQTGLRFASGKQRGTLRPERYGDVKSAGGVVVRRVEHPPLPQRSTLKSSLDELRSTIISNIYSGAARGIRHG